MAYKQILFILSLISLISSIACSQNKANLDSLETILSQKNNLNADALPLLQTLAISHTSDSDKKLFYSQELITAATLLDSANQIISGYTELGNAYALKSDIQQALKSYISAAEIASKHNKSDRLARVYLSIADMLAEINNHEEAIKYFKIAIEVLKTNDDLVNLASAYLNLGDVLFIQNKLDSALHYTLQSEVLFTGLGHELGLAYSLGNKGMIFAKLNKDRAAETEMNKAMTIMKNLGVYDPIPIYLIHLSDLFLENNDVPRALSHAQEGLDIAKKYGFKDQISEATLQLHEIYEHTGDIAKSLAYYKEHIRYRDSVTNLVGVQEMADLRSDFEISQKQVEVDLLNEQKKNKELANNAMKIILGLISLILLTMFWFYKSISKQKDRADSLLLNILPEETATELKKTGKVQAKRFESVSVLFADFKGFTSYSSNLSPTELVKTLDVYFSKFDELVEKYNLEKIKTIGDAYMCSGGLPFVTDDHAVKMVKLALDMLAFTQAELTSDHKADRFDVRIGINTGPVVAGVVGTKKFAYDIWGDTVNIASRMESNSAAGRINISKYTYELVKDHFDCEYRGEIEVKNKGLMAMYFVLGLKN